METTIKKTLKYILSATIAIVLLGFAFRDVQWAEFIEGLRSCRMGWIVVSMAAGAFAF